MGMLNPGPRASCWAALHGCCPFFLAQQHKAEPVWVVPTAGPHEAMSLGSRQQKLWVCGATLFPISPFTTWEGEEGRAS